MSVVREFSCIIYICIYFFKLKINSHRFGLYLGFNTLHFALLSKSFSGYIKLYTINQLKLDSKDLDSFIAQDIYHG